MFTHTCIQISLQMPLRLNPLVQMSHLIFRLFALSADNTVGLRTDANTTEILSNQVLFLMRLSFVGTKNPLMAYQGRTGQQGAGRINKAESTAQNSYCA